MDIAQVPLGSPALQSPELVCYRDEQEGTNLPPRNVLGSSASLASLVPTLTANPAQEIQVHSPVVSAH